MKHNDDLPAGQLLIVEYERVKEEQKARIGFRDNLLYVTLAAMAAVIAATLQAGGRAHLLLLLPPVSVVLGWTYLVNDEKISAIGRYVRAELAPRLQAAAGVTTPVFGWETAHRSDTRRKTRKRLQLAADLTAFCVAPVAAIVVYWVNGPWRPAFLAVSAAEAVALVVLAWQVVLYADLAGGSAPGPDPDEPSVPAQAATSTSGRGRRLSDR